LRNIACVQKKVRLRGRAVNAVDGDLQRGGHIGVSLFAESDMRVADLDETEIRSFHFAHLIPAHRTLRQRQ
jgi:hypothetical protein